MLSTQNAISSSNLSRQWFTRAQYNVHQELRLLQIIHCSGKCGVEDFFWPLSIVKPWKSTMKRCCFWKESQNPQKWLLCREYLLQVRPWARGFMCLILFNSANLGGIIPLWPRKLLKVKQLTSGAGEKSCSGHEHLLTPSHRHTSPGQLAGHVTAVGTRQRRGRPRRRHRAEKDSLAMGCESGVIGDPAKYV